MIKLRRRRPIPPSSSLGSSQSLDPADLPHVRHALMGATLVVALAISVILVRLWYMQLLHGEQYRRLSESNRLRLVDLPPRRGNIYDRQGRLLAEVRPSFSLAVVPEDVSDWSLLARRLAGLVGVSASDLARARLAARSQQPFKPIRIKTHLSYKELALLETYRYELTGVKVRVEYERYYLAAKELSHLLGYLSEINQGELKRWPKERYRLGDLVGRAGLEKSRERVLHGARGMRQVEVDVVGRELTVLKQVLPKPGHNLVLSIDLDLQKAAAKALGDMSGAVVAMNPNNGQVYALYSSPSYDSNQFSAGISPKQWRLLSNDPSHPLKDRAISGVYPPGSTFKIVTAAAGLAEGVITPQTTLFCSGAMKFGRRTYQCWAIKKGGHGWVNFRRAIKESCDIYFYNVGLRLGVDRLAKWAKAFGLGRTTGVPLFNEGVGLVPTSAWKKRRFGIPWQRGETLSIAIGQGFNQATPIQLARMVSVVANRGRLVTPTLVKAVVPYGRQRQVPEPLGLSIPVKIKKHILKKIHEGMVAVVNEPHGTARRARLPKIKVAGKTGTSQVVALKYFKLYGKKENVPLKYRDHSVFVAYAPAEKPQIAVAVVVEHGGSGSRAAAPVANRVMRAYFGIEQLPPPDIDPRKRKPPTKIAPKLKPKPPARARAKPARKPVAKAKARSRVKAKAKARSKARPKSRSVAARKSATRVKPVLRPRRQSRPKAKPAARPRPAARERPPLRPPARPPGAAASAAPAQTPAAQPRLVPKLKPPKLPRTPAPTILPPRPRSKPASEVMREQAPREVEE